ncbi:hypothetical protein AHF37_00199 [Paragonimus kellicotti]|nr:hypothetical protein AHF37_00199 [Paragonimus kellicotti]
MAKVVETERLLCVETQKKECNKRRLHVNTSCISSAGPNNVIIAYNQPHLIVDIDDADLNQPVLYCKRFQTITDFWVHGISSSKLYIFEIWTGKSVTVW